MITQQRATLIFRKLHHFYGDKSHAAPQPAASRLVKINTISAELLLTVCSKSCYTCVLNSILILIFFHVKALQFRNTLCNLLQGIWHFPQWDTKVNCGLSFLFFLYMQVKQAHTYYRNGSARWHTSAALFSFNLTTADKERLRACQYIPLRCRNHKLSSTQRWTSTQRNAT